MTTCPKCDTIKLVYVEAGPFAKQWHLDCACSYAWHKSSFCYSKRKLKRNWERYMNEYEKNHQKEKLV